MQSTLYNTIYPYLIQFAMILNAGLYVTSLVADREQGMRYLLNFHGIGHTAYIVGITAADFSIATIPSALLVLFGLILDLDVFKSYGIEVFLSLVVFNIPFIMLINILGFVFQKAETAFKYILLIIFSVHAVGMMLVVLTDYKLQ